MSKSTKSSVLLAGAILLAILLTGCTDEPSPTPTPVPTATDTPVPTATPTPAPSEPGPGLTGQQMAVIMLTQEDIDTEFLSLEFSPGDSGFNNNADAAQGTFDPNDTESDMTAAGRITGYSHRFDNLLQLFGEGDGGPLSVYTEIHVLKDEGSASEFLAMLATEPMRFEGMEEEGVILRSATPVVPDVALGDESKGYQAEIETPGFGTYLLYGALWRRGSDVLFVGYLGDRDSDPGESVWRLAARMDERVEPALSGEITAVPLPPAIETPTPEPSGPGTEPERLALDQGYDLRKLTDLGGLLPGFQVTSESFSKDDSEITFEREYEPESLSAPVGDSEVMIVATDFDLFETEFEASVTIGILSAMEPDTWASLFALGIAAMMGTDLGESSIETEKLDVTIEDVSGFSSAFGAAPLRFQVHMYFLGRGRLAGFVMVLGTDLRAEDTFPLAAEIAARVTAATPT